MRTDIEIFSCKFFKEFAVHPDMRIISIAIDSEQNHDRLIQLILSKHLSLTEAEGFLVDRFEDDLADLIVAARFRHYWHEEFLDHQFVSLVDQIQLESGSSENRILVVVFFVAVLAVRVVLDCFVLVHFLLDGR